MTKVVIHTPEPETVSEAFTKPEWVKAMDEEMNKAIEKNETWTLVKPPPDAHIIGWLIKWNRINYSTNGFRRNLGHFYLCSFTLMLVNQLKLPSPPPLQLEDL